MDALSEAAAAMLGLQLTSRQKSDFQTYADALTDWNARINLTAMTDPLAIQMRHFMDSLTCLLVLNQSDDLHSQRVIDVGSGAGFPGLPLKLVYPDLKLTLLEATGKKASFLEHVVSLLKLEGVTIVHARAEEVGQQEEHREGYDWVLARAVAGMRVLAEYLLPLCRVGGRCLAQKGEQAHHEVSEAQQAITMLGGQVRQLHEVMLPTIAETRYLVDIDKVAATPPAYPRRPGRPAKRPL